MSHPSHESSHEKQFPPTAEGLGGALDHALAQHGGAIIHEEAQKGDMNGATGGDVLRLYPNPKDPREVITIVPVGINAYTRRFADAQTVQLAYGGSREPGNGVYRVSGNPGERKLLDMVPHPDIKVPRVYEPALAGEAHFDSVIGALRRASAERPAGRAKRVFQKLGSLAGQ